MNALQPPQTKQPTATHSAASADFSRLARVVDSTTGELRPESALLAAGGGLLFGPSGPGLSYVPYLAAEGETLLSVRRYADALHFERIRTPAQEVRAREEKAAGLVEKEKDSAWWRAKDPRSAAREVAEEAESARKRGAVRGFSDDARRRMARHCSKIRNLAAASFVTLTLSDELVGKFWSKWDAKPDAELMADFMRTNLAALDKRGQRFWTRDGHSFGFVWKLEFQRRKTGRYQGHLVPHMHLIVSGLEHVAITRQRRWLKAAWWHVCGEAQDGHERAGVQVDKVYSRAGAGVYVAKYVAKRSDDAEDSELEIGRRWGTRGTVDTSGEEVSVITLAQYVQIRRYVARWLRGRWKGGARYSRIIRRPRGTGDALFIFGAGFESATGWGLSESLMRSLPDLEE